MSSFSAASNDTSTTTRPRILLTGGCGYIASHALVVLLEAGYDVTIVDNLVNSSVESTHRVVNRIVKCDPARVRYFNVDLRDSSALEVVFKTTGTPFHAVIHFAGLKAVGESVEKPLLYYDVNVGGTIVLLGLMQKYNCRNIVFSSSATVYGAAPSPITEETPVGNGITNAYGRTKYMIEEIIRDFIASRNRSVAPAEAATAAWSAVILRYFNPVGSHPSGHIGEDPYGPPNNLMPFVAQVAVGRRDKLTIFGNDYDTPDGTGVRDYIHVMDLAEGHLAAVKHIEAATATAGTAPLSATVTLPVGMMDVFNLGTGVGCSVLDMVKAMEAACGHTIPYVIGARRSGDIDTCYADTTRAATVLNWRSSRTLQDCCTDLWKWQSNNPQGYGSSSA